MYFSEMGFMYFSEIYCFASVVVGFGYFFVVRALKSFGEVIRNCNAVNGAAWNYVHRAFP